MAKIYDTLKGLITHDMVTKAAHTLDEDKNKVSAAISVLLPSLLGVMAKKGYNTRLDTVVTEAGMANLISRKHELFEGHGITDDVNYGERFENALLTVKDHKFMSNVAAKSGLKFTSSDRLCNWVCGLMAGWFGEQVTHHKANLNDIINQLNMEKDSFDPDIPDEVCQKFGVGKGGKKKMGWLWWLLGLILLAIICCLLWRSCHKPRVIENVAAAGIVTEVVKAEVAAPANTDEWQQMENREKTELTLPNGEKITVYKDGFEDKVLAFLNSNEWKNATSAQLQHIWFEFDGITFKHDSPNELMPGSEVQLNNLIAILKSHTIPKIIIGGHADKTGTSPVNMDISKARAEFIKTTFEKNGISAASLSTEGFGKELATHPATAPDSERALDRYLGLRFDK